MMNTKKNAKDFCTALFQSWLRVDSAYLPSKKEAAARNGAKKA